MPYLSDTLEDFTAKLSSKAPVPGGGGAAAVAGALGAALSSMVANLTMGKKKYAQYETELAEILLKAAELSKRLMSLADADAEAFSPLAAAYSIPRDDPGRAGVMESALDGACAPPLCIMRACCETIAIHERLLTCGTVMAVSDVGAGAALAGAALRAASYNVFINAGSMANATRATALRGEAGSMLEEYLPRAEKVMLAVEARIK